MGAAINGMALHGGVKVFGGTFFVFSDYLRPAIRLAALMGFPVTYVFTHDSIAVGEDGPTMSQSNNLHHYVQCQIFLLFVLQMEMKQLQHGSLPLNHRTNQLPYINSSRSYQHLKGTAENAYEGVKKVHTLFLLLNKETADVLLLATGSEVNLAVEAQKELAKEGIDASVVSMPSWDRFEEQSKEYKESVIPKQ